VSLSLSLARRLFTFFLDSFVERVPLRGRRDGKTKMYNSPVKLGWLDCISPRRVVPRRIVANFTRHDRREPARARGRVSRVRSHSRPRWRWSDARYPLAAAFPPSSTRGSRSVCPSFATTGFASLAESRVDRRRCHSPISSFRRSINRSARYCRTVHDTRAGTHLRETSPVILTADERARASKSAARYERSRVAP